MMIHKMELPKAFGTATLSGMFYEAFMKGVSKEKYVEVGKSVLSIPFVFSIGFRTLPELDLIVSEAGCFAQMCWDQFGMKPVMTFV
jgi:hypothetical protein